jgi:hypothetical protein
MFLSYFTLLTALSLSMVAAWYSILGLTAIFASAVIPIIIMGTILEVAKVTVTVWLHEYWHRCQWLMKVYLVPAVAMLMVITSMGIFGFLSKAHSDQSLVSGDVQSKIAIYDEKIRTAKDNIEADRKQLKQMDEAVDQIMGRSSDEKGADKANAVRKSQQRDRQALAKDIEANQKIVAQLNDEAAPIRAEVRKVEAEVGPIKYIAAFIYGDNPDANLLERAVRWVIIILVVVFDPLAIMMVLSATESLKWERECRSQPPAYEADDGPLTDDQIKQLKKLTEEDLPTGETAATSQLFDDPGEHPADTFEADVEPLEPPVNYMYGQMQPDALTAEEIDEIIGEFDRVRKSISAMSHNSDHLEHAAGPVSEDLPEADEEIDDNDPMKKAIKEWKDANPGTTLKEQRARFAAGKIQELPWMRLMTDNDLSRKPLSGFGTDFPENAEKGDTFMRVDRMPNVLYKYNGQNWIIVDKTLTDNYTYDDAYIEHLITQLESGEYDPDMLSDVEADAIARRVKSIKI